MRKVTWADEAVRKELAALRETAPFVYGLTNYVAANLSANVLLAVGAAPAIGAAPDWPEAFAAGAGAMWINTAALMSSSPETLLAAARSADAAGTPWVLDPVGAGAIPQRTAFALELCRLRPSAIRGNASEILGLRGGAGGTERIS